MYLVVYELRNTGLTDWILSIQTDLSNEWKASPPSTRFSLPVPGSHSEYRLQATLDNYYP